MAGRDSLDVITSAIDELGIGGFTHTVDETGDLWQELDVLSQPAWIFVDADGRTELVIGSLGEERISERLDGLLAR